MISSSFTFSNFGLQISFIWGDFDILDSLVIGIWASDISSGALALSETPKAQNKQQAVFR
jgi:hypothetical protein